MKEKVIEIVGVALMAGMEKCRAHEVRSPIRAEGQGAHGAVGESLLSNKPRKLINSRVSVYLPLVRVGVQFILLWQGGRSSRLFRTVIFLPSHRRQSPLCPEKKFSCRWKPSKYTFAVSGK